MTDFYVRKGESGSPKGPLAFVHLKELVRNGRLLSNDWVSIDGKNWIRAKEVDGIFEEQNKEEKNRCPYCGEFILAIAIKCKHCGEFINNKAAATTNTTNQAHAINNNCGDKKVDAMPSARKQMGAEKIIWSSKPSWIGLLPFCSIGFLILIACGSSKLLLLGILGGLSLCVYAFWDRENTVYTLTSMRVSAKSGILSTSTQIVDLKNITFINASNTTLTNTGHIEIGSSGKSGIEIKFLNVDDPNRIKAMIIQAKDATTQIG